MKGLEPQLYECLAATFRQTYPPEKLTIYFCISNRNDPAFPVLERLHADFPQFDATVLVEEEDPNLSGQHGELENLGPNPKIRNLSRGYKEAKGDIMWIVDCNVWIGKGVGGRMVDKLCGYGDGGKPSRPHKFVHQLPVVVDSVGSNECEEGRGISKGPLLEHQVSSTSSAAYAVASLPKNECLLARRLRTGGGRLEEMFMTTAHAKSYTAINIVAVAPCTLGKSTMFRRSHLNHLTKGSAYAPGIDLFSESICEDHLIGDLLWRKQVPEEEAGQRFNKHGLVLGDLVIQPMARMSVHEYWARRVRWIRVRKWTVLLATFVEPHIECFLISAYGALAVTSLPFFLKNFGIPQTWTAFACLYLASIICWIIQDYMTFALLQAGVTIELDEHTPSFARPPPGLMRRSKMEWLLAWFGRELLAFPIWAWAFLGGTTVLWRGKRFRIGLDMKVKEVKEGKALGSLIVGNGSTRSSRKDRLD